MPLTTGEFLTQIALAVTPTALGEALNGSPATIAEWSTALQANAVGEDPAVVAALNTTLTDPAYAPLFNVLLTQVWTAPAGQPQPIARVLKNLTWALGKQNAPPILNFPWPSPPHPGGGDVTNLVTLLGPFDETR